jgi:hypothetical protein
MSKQPPRLTRLEVFALVVSAIGTVYCLGLLYLAYSSR